MHNVEPSKKPKLIIFKGPYYAVLKCICQAANTAVPEYTYFLPIPIFMQKFNSSEQNYGERNLLLYTVLSLFSLCTFLLTVFVLRVLLSSYVYLFILFVFVVPYVCLLYCVCIAVLTLDARLLARSQYPERPATGHLDTGFSWFPCVYKRMLRRFPSCYYMPLM